MGELSSEPPRATVRGASPLPVEIVRSVLEAGSVTVVADAEEGVVHVLLEPAPEDWPESTDANPIVVVTTKADEEVLIDALRQGADAVIDITERTDCVVKAVQIVHAGGTLLSPAQARVVANALRRASGPAPVTLTRRERDILESIELGHSVKQTARHLGISPKTVENLQSRLFRKLSVRNRAQAVAVAHRAGLLDSTPTHTP